MKRMKYLTGLLIAGAAFVIVSCNSDDQIVPASVTNLRGESTPGRIVLRWDTPKESNIKYIMVNYHDPLLKKDVLKTASVYADSIEIPDTRQKYGEYTFNVLSVSPTEDKSDVQTITLTSKPAPITIAVTDRKPVALTVSQLYADSQEPSEGPIANLINGNVSDYFHAAWSVDNGPMPHYIVIDLGKLVKGVRLSYTTRNHGGGGNHPNNITILASKVFDGKTYDSSKATKCVDIVSDLPKTAKTGYTTSDILFDQEYRYVWYRVNSTYGVTSYFALAEISVEELILNIDNPEAPDAAE